MLNNRLLVLLLCAAFLGGCGSLGAGVPLSNSEKPKASSQFAMAQSGSSTGTVSEANSTTKIPVKKRAETPVKKPAEKPRSAESTPTTNAPVVLDATTPNVGSTDWEREKRQNDRQEEHLKQVIDGICHGC